MIAIVAIFSISIILYNYAFFLVVGDGFLSAAEAFGLIEMGRMCLKRAGREARPVGKLGAGW